jgi:two-component system sensor histidine kinase/response regulator
LAFGEKAFIMNSLRFLLVHRNPEQSEAIVALLARADHSVLPASGLEEAADALTVERFDAVLMDSAYRSQALEEFSAQVRRMERAQRSTRVPLIVLANGNSGDFESVLDAVMPEPLDPDALTAAVSQLARAVGHAGENTLDSDISPLGILDPEKFREQVGYDDELMVEIIDLFLVERERQEPEMREALMAGQFDLLCRLAHTIKGSLGSLHAMKARTHAQELESAAQRSEEDVCWASLAALELDLAELEPELLALRA